MRIPLHYQQCVLAVLGLSPAQRREIASDISENVCEEVSEAVERAARAALSGRKRAYINVFVVIAEHGEEIEIRKVPQKGGAA